MSFLACYGSLDVIADCTPPAAPKLPALTVVEPLPLRIGCLGGGGGGGGGIALPFFPPGGGGGGGAFLSIGGGGGGGAKPPVRGPRIGEGAYY